MILITGSTGYIGSHISQYFEKKKIKYIGIDNFSSSYLSNVTKKKNHYKLDISNTKKINQLIDKFKINTIIHAAAHSYVLEGEKYKKKYYFNNVIKTKKFINLCKKTKIKNFIFFSSSNVYQENRKNKISEKNKLYSKNFYGKNKLIIEKHLISNKFDKLIILRLFNIIGVFNNRFKFFKFRKMKYQRLLFQIIDKIEKRKLFRLRFFLINKKKIFPSRDFIDIKILCVVVDQLIKYLELKNNFFKIFNVGSGISTPINKIVNFFQERKKKKLNFKYQKINKKELIKTHADISKLEKFLGKKIKYNLKSSLLSHL